MGLSRIRRTALACWLAHAASAGAQTPEGTTLDSVASVQQVAYGGDVGSKASQRFVMPSGYAEVRGELSFLTSEAIVTPGKLRFGDAALFRPSARRALGDQLELSVGTSLLAKQPEAGSDWIWQGGSLGALYEAWPGYAVQLDVSGGPALGGQGSVWSASPALAAKWSLDRQTRLLLSLANPFTAIDAAGGLRPRTWLDELALGAEAQFGDGDGGGWVALDYGIPLAHAGEVAGAAALALDPSVHLDVQVGGVIQVGSHDDWNLFAYYCWIDRGERGHPETLLPVLDGGFDQQQIVLGVSHRFEPKRHPTD